MLIGRIMAERAALAGKSGYWGEGAATAMWSARLFVILSRHGLCPRDLTDAICGEQARSTKRKGSPNETGKKNRPDNRWNERHRP
jgi:hypothetical protein